LIYQESLKGKHARDEDTLMEEEEAFGSKFGAYLCPNPGSAANMTSRKQRLIFLEIDRNDPYSVLDVGKVADLVLVVMSCKETNVSGVKDDPFLHSKAIDEIGYRALSLIRSQGMPSLIGVLQHLEAISSVKQPYVKKLFQRIFTSEFTDKYKFMFQNNSTDN
jgi:pre-rRNA-processing protein TSR1